MIYFLILWIRNITTGLEFTCFLEFCLNWHLVAFKGAAGWKVSTHLLALIRTFLLTWFGFAQHVQFCPVQSSRDSYFHYNKTTCLKVCVINQRWAVWKISLWSAKSGNSVFISGNLNCRWWHSKLQQISECANTGEKLNFTVRNYKITRRSTLRHFYLLKTPSVCCTDMSWVSPHRPVWGVETVGSGLKVSPELA